MSFVKQLAATVGLCFMTALPSCSPKIVERVKVVTEYRNVYQVDTTIQHDSVYIREFVKGDTVRIVEYRDKYVYRYNTIRDTSYLRDSVTIETLKTRYVEKPLSWSQKARIGAFPWLLLVAVGLAVWTFRKSLLPWFTKLWNLIFK